MEALAADLARFRNQDPVEAYRESIDRAGGPAVPAVRTADPAAAGVYRDAVRAAGLARNLGHRSRITRMHDRRDDVEECLQEEQMRKPVFAMLLGGFLGVFDGLTALLSGARRCRR